MKPKRLKIWHVPKNLVFGARLQIDELGIALNVSLAHWEMLLILKG